MSEQANSKLNLAESIFKSLVWDTTIEAEITALYSSAPWLNVWPLKQIVHGIATLVTDRLYSNLKTSIDVEAISLINAQEKSAFDKASVTLQVIATEKGIESDEYKKARDTAKAAFSEFVRYGSSVS